MNSEEVAQLDGDEVELERLVAAFVREFHRLPSGAQMEQEGFSLVPPRRGDAGGNRAAPDITHAGGASVCSASG